MKKIVIALVVVVAVVGVIGLVFGKQIALSFASRETKACVKMGELCAADKEATSADLDACVEGWDEARKLAGEKNTEKSLACVEESKTCMAATGCMVGGVGVGAINELIKGFGDSVSR